MSESSAPTEGINTEATGEQDEAARAGEGPSKRPRRADDPRWQRLERLGQAYLKVSRQVARLLSGAGR